MSDLIRREDVVEALYQAIRTTLTGTFTDSMSLAIAMANDLPSAEPEREWIPVTEALPKMKEVVLITNGKGHVTYGQYQGTFRNNNNEWFWRHKTLETVLAWMPLPEPWRGEK